MGYLVRCDQVLQRTEQTREPAPYYNIAGETVTILGGTGYRLPTAAEWEYACRAGSTTKFGFGDAEEKLGEFAWFSGNADGNYTTHRVAQKGKNGFGLFDMHGNVSEWCWDWFVENSRDASPKEVDNDPAGPESGRYKVIRGGSYSSIAQDTGCSSESEYAAPDKPSKETGFRVARSIPGPR